MFVYFTQVLTFGQVKLQQHFNSGPPRQGNFYFPNQFPSNQPNRQTQQSTFNRPRNPQASQYQQPSRVASFQGRISLQKCNEYISKAHESVLVGSLALGSNIQGIDTEQCDFSQGLIIGGINAKPAEFPHMAAIGYFDINDQIKFPCGGSLISERHVLTAAHCKKTRDLTPSFVRLGVLNIRDDSQQDIPIESFIVHEQYRARNRKNDIAVVKLRRSITLTKELRPACLIQPNIPYQHKKPIATGWGLTESVSDKFSDILQKVEINFIGNRQCNEYFSDDQSIDNTQLCAGLGGKDTCQGDSGGPLQITSDKNKCIYIIVGITSFGNVDCGAVNSAGVYTSVLAYLDWIEQKVWG